MLGDDAAQGGTAELKLGEHASSNGSESSVKALGIMMVQNHVKANEELKAWAKSARYTLRSSINAEQQKTYDEVKTKKGLDFDKMFS